MWLTAAVLLTHIARGIGTFVQRVGHMRRHWCLHFVLTVHHRAGQGEGATAGGVVTANGRGCVHASLIDALQFHLIMMYP